MRTGAIVVGDVIVGVEGTEIVTQDDLFQALENRTPGEEVTVRLARGSEQREVRILLQAIASD